MQTSTLLGRRFPILAHLATLLGVAASMPVAASNPADKAFTPPAATNLSFVANGNQWPKSVLFATDVPGGRLYFERGRLMQTLYDVEQLHQLHERGADGRHNRVRAHAYSVTFVGANEQALTKGEAPNGSYNNYFIGNDKSQWASNVPIYNEVRYQELYPGTNLRFYTKDEHLEYDFELAPGADARRIKLHYEGAQKLSVVKGALHIVTSVGTVVEQSPVAYQLVQGQRVAVPCAFKLDARDNLSFVFPQGYNKQLPLVIDPVLVYSTFSGSSANNYGYTATYDEQGNLYSGGVVFSSGFPTTTGAYDVNYASGRDYGIMKFNPAATGAASRVYGTYIGGNSDDHPHSMVVDPAGNLLILGSTESNNFPSTTGTVDPDYNGGADIVVSKLSADGGQLLASTFLGGTASDGQTPSDLRKNYGDTYRGDITTDAQGNVYLASTSASTGFPTRNGFQLVKSTGADAVIVKLNSGLSNIVWSTFLGGTGQDMAYSVQVDSTGTVFVSGGTNGTNLPGTAGGLHASARGGIDGFVARIAPLGSDLIQSTYIGTAGYDQAYFVQLDRRGDVYLYGQTDGAYPVSQGVYSNPNSRQFIHKINRSLTTTIFSTVVGNGAVGTGGINISPTAFLVDNCGQILLAGWGGEQGTGNITNMPTTPDALIRTIPGNDGYHYIMQLSGNAGRLVYGTYFGNGSCHVDGGTSRFDKRGIIYASMCVGSNSGSITTSGAWATSKGSGSYNNASFKMDVLQLNANFTPSSTPGGSRIRSGCAPLTVYFTRPSITGTNSSWVFGNGQTSTSTASQVTTVYTTPGRYIARLTVTDPSNCLQSVTATDTIDVFGLPPAAAGPDRTICQGSSVTITVPDAGVGVTYRWFPGIGLNTTQGRTIIASPTATTSYVLSTSTGNGCVNRDTVVVTVNGQPQAVAGPDRTICQGGSVSITAADAGAGPNVTYSWSPATGLNTTQGRTIIASPTATTSYVLTTTTPAGCTSQATVTVNVTPPPPVLIAPERVLCQGSSTTLTAFESGTGLAYRWSPSTGLSSTQGRSVTATPATTTTYVVTATTAEGCTSTTSFEVKVDARPQVSIAASTANAFTSEPVVFSNTTTGTPTSYLWEFGDGRSSTERAPAHTYEQDGDYTVRLTTRFGTGGQCSEVKTLDLSARTFALPNVITPNGDDKNETFKPFVTFEPVAISIFNRWGKKVYEQSNYVDGWGRDNVPAGIYYYRITNQAGASWKGWVEVIR